jgi:hypothetical protein
MVIGCGKGHNIHLSLFYDITPYQKIRVFFDLPRVFGYIPFAVDHIRPTTSEAKG